MKKCYKIFSCTLLVLCSYAPHVNAQSTQFGIGGPGHTPGPGGIAVRYVGWDGTPAANAIPLSIEHRGTNNINFLTGGIQRMTILGTLVPATAGYVGIRTAAPIFPFTVVGDGGNLVTTSGWHAGMLLQNHAVFAWDNDGIPGANAVFMGHPSFNADHSFFCGLAPNVGSAAVPNYIYRIVDIPAAGTPPNSGDFEFLPGTNNHNVLIDRNLGVGLDVGVAPLYTPTNRVEINTVSSTTNPIIPPVLAPNGLSASGVGNGFGGTGFSGLRFTDLRSTSTPRTTNPGTGVLSVDVNGDVILVPAGGTGNVTSTCATINQIPKMSSATNLVCSQIFDDGTSVGVAPVPYVLSPLMKFEVKGSVSIYDGTGSNNNGDNSLFFGREQTTLTAPATDLGEWGIQYTPPATIGNPVGGINFWKPFGSDGGFGNNFLYLSNNGNIGIGTPNPINRTEITSGSVVLAPANSAVVTRSGLRFTNMNATMVVDGNANSSNTILSVNDDGDVILVPGATGIGAGYCNALTSLAGNSAGYDLNTFNFYFAGNGSANAAQNNVVIGNTCSYTPVAKLDLLQASTATTGTTGINVLNTDESVSGTVYGVQSILIPTTLSPGDVGYTAGFFHALAAKQCIGVYGLADGLSSNGTGNYGGIFRGEKGGNNVGVYARAFSANSANFGGYFLASGGNTSTNYAGWFAADTGANVNYGVRTEANAGTGTNYGIYAESLPAPGNGGGPNYAGYFNGDVVFTGYFGPPSDQQFKQNIDTITNALGIINQLAPKTFFFDTTAFTQMAFSSKRQYGLIAQQVQSILPELVHNDVQPAVTDASGNIITPAINYKSLNYNAFIAILMKGIQEQQKQINSQKDSIDSLRNQMNSCCAMNSRTQNPSINHTANQTDVTLTNSESVVLNQNVPNPFAEQTTITYNLPESVQKAQLLFYDATGKLIKSVDLNGRGNGQINVFANDLSNGIYSYALVVDGQIADTKRMVKTN